MALISKLETCTPEQLIRIHEATLELLETVGVAFHDLEARELFKKHGAKIEGDIVFIPRKLVEASLKQCPSSYTWQAANEAHSISIGTGPILGPLIGDCKIMDYEHGLRLSTIDDVIKITKISQESKIMGFVSNNICEPNDIPVEHRNLRTIYETMKHSDKPFLAYSIIPSGKVAREMLEMIEIRFGALSKDKIFTLLSAPSTSPLQWDSCGIQSMMEFARRGQPIALCPCSITGVSSPIDLLGTSLQGNVEILSALVLVQLVNPGCPVVYSHNSIPTHFKAITALWGSPDFYLINLTNMQLGKKLYNLPTRACSAVTTARTVDYSAAIETTQNIFTAVLGGLDIVYCSCGVLDNLITYSYEKQIFDEEIFSRAKRLYDGIEFTDETLSVDTIKAIGIGGNYLKHPSTVRKYRQGWQPMVSNYDLGDESRADVMKNAHETVVQRLANARETYLDPAIDKELQRYMKKTLNLA